MLPASDGPASDSPASDSSARLYVGGSWADGLLDGAVMGAFPGRVLPWARVPSSTYRHCMCDCMCYVHCLSANSREILSICVVM